MWAKQKETLKAKHRLQTRTACECPSHGTHFLSWSIWAEIWIWRCPKNQGHQSFIIRIYIYTHTCIYSIWVGRSQWMFVYFWTPNSETHSLASSCWVSTSVLHICDCFLSTLIQPLEDKNVESQSYCTPWLSFEIHKEIQGTSEYPPRKIKLGHVKPHHMLIGPQGQLCFCNLFGWYMETGKTIENHSFSKPDAMLCVCVSVFVQSNHIHVQKSVGV